MLRTPFLIVLSVFATWALVHGQCTRPPDPETAYLSADYAAVVRTAADGVPRPREALMTGLSYVAQQRYAEAGMFFGELPGQGGSDMAVVRTCGRLEIEVRSGRYDDAGAVASSCRDALGALPAGLSDVSGYGWHVLGYFEHAAARYERALTLYARALRSLPTSGRFSDYLSLNTRNNIGNVYYRTGRSTEALRMHRRVHAERVVLLGPEHPKTGGSIGNLGNVYHSLGEYEKALYFHRRAADIWRRTAGAFDPEYAYSLNNIGLALMRLNRNADATTALNQSLRIKRTVFGDSSATLVNTVANLTATYMRMDSLDQALAMARFTRGVARRHGLSETPGLWAFEADRAVLLELTGDPEAAANALEAALTAARSARHPVAFRLANTLARIHLRSETPARATALLAWVDDCVRSCSWSPVSDSTLAAEPPVEESVREWLEAHRLWMRAPSPGATWRVEHAATTAERLQSGSWSLKFDRMWYAQALALYRGLTDRAVHDTDAALAWRAVEARKGLFVRRVARDREQVEPAMERLMEVESALATAESELDAPSGGRAGDLPEDVARLIAERVRIQMAFERTPRSREASRGPSDPDLDTAEAPLATIMRRLGDTSGTYLNYFWSGSPSVLHALVVTADTVHMVQLAARPAIESSVRTLRHVLSGGSRSEMERASTDVSALLLQPLLAYLATGPVIISPDEDIYDLPFEVLRTGTERQRFSYFVESRTVSYAHTAYAWADTPDFSRDHPLRATLLDVTFPDAVLPSLPGRRQAQNGADRQAALRRAPLPGVRTETRALRNVLEQAGTSNVRYVRDATEAHFAREASIPTDILHVATHSYFDATTPHDSGILFARSPFGGSDGVLRPAEMARLEVPAQLLVLSSCSVARRTGGLSAAFDFGIAMGLSGVRRAVVSNWPVDDVATTEFMVRFYTFIIAGASPESALSQTKVSFLREASPLADPAIWSAFVLIAT